MKVIEGIGVNGEMELNKEKKNIIGITQSEIDTNPMLEQHPEWK